MPPTEAASNPLAARRRNGKSRRGRSEDRRRAAAPSRPRGKPAEPPPAYAGSTRQSRWVRPAPVRPAAKTPSRARSNDGLALSPRQPLGSLAGGRSTTGRATQIKSQRSSNVASASDATPASQRPMNHSSRRKRANGG